MPALAEGIEQVRNELSRRPIGRGVASVRRSSGGASDADRGNERARPDGQARRNSLIYDE